MRYFLLTAMILFTAAMQRSFGQDRLLSTVYLAKNQYNIGSAYKPVLKNLALKCSSGSTVLIKILGYAYAAGSVRYNEGLSMIKISSVYKFLQSCVKIDCNKVHFCANGSFDEWHDLHLKGAHIQQRAVDILLEFKHKK